MKWSGMLLAAALAGFVAGCAEPGPQAPGNPPSTSQAEAPPVETPPAAPGDSAGKDVPEPPVASQAAPGAPAKVAESEYKTTPSGLKYAVLKKGTGAEAKGDQEVSVHYTGWLKSTGEKFDSSLDRGEPISFPLGHGQVIPGWDEGVKGMKVGERRQLVIPSKLGYGEQGTPGGPIPPNATLVFDVELVKVGEPHNH